MRKWILCSKEWVNFAISRVSTQKQFLRGQLYVEVWLNWLLLRNLFKYLLHVGGVYCCSTGEEQFSYNVLGEVHHLLSLSKCCIDRNLIMSCSLAWRHLSLCINEENKLLNLLLVAMHISFCNFLLLSYFLSLI